MDQPLEGLRPGVRGRGWRGNRVLVVILEGEVKVGQLFPGTDIGHSGQVEGETVLKGAPDQKRLAYPPAAVNRDKNRRLRLRQLFQKSSLGLSADKGFHGKFGCELGKVLVSANYYLKFGCNWRFLFVSANNRGLKLGRNVPRV